MCQVSIDVRRPHQKLGKQSYRLGCAVVWVLGLEVKTSTRAGSALNSSAEIALQPLPCFLQGLFSAPPFASPLTSLILLNQLCRKYTCLSGPVPSSQTAILWSTEQLPLVSGLPRHLQHGQGTKSSINFCFLTEHLF